MVVEFLTFEVAEADLPGWLAADDEVWTAFLRRQPGFVRKERWVEAKGAGPGLVHAVIWWETREDWKRITEAQVDEVDALMGPWFREAACREFVVRP